MGPDSIKSHNESSIRISLQTLRSWANKLGIREVDLADIVDSYLDNGLSVSQIFNLLFFQNEDGKRHRSTERTKAESFGYAGQNPGKISRRRELNKGEIKKRYLEYARRYMRLRRLGLTIEPWEESEG